MNWGLALTPSFSASSSTILPTENQRAAFNRCGPSAISLSGHISAAYFLNGLVVGIRHRWISQVTSALLERSTYYSVDWKVASVLRGPCVPRSASLAGNSPARPRRRRPLGRRKPHQGRLALSLSRFLDVTLSTIDASVLFPLVLDGRVGA